MKASLKLMLVSVALTPLAFYLGVLVPYVTPKNLFLRGLLFLTSLLCAVVYVREQSFRESFAKRLSHLAESPIARCLGVFLLALVASTIFAHVPSLAFFGEPTNGEGLLGLMWYFVLFFFAAMLFERREWTLFFRTTVATGAILFLIEVVQSLLGAVRPDALAGNPIYLAGYFLFVIFAALMLSIEAKEKNNTALLWLSRLSVALSLIGIFITKTRGVMLGVFAGALVALAYAALAEKQFLFGGRVLARKAALVAAGLLIVFAGLFFVTRHAPLWSHVPGLDRLAQSGAGAEGIKSRLINVRIALHAVDPARTNAKTLVLGWGWDNYVFAWQRFYEPSLYFYDSAIFDRTHNTLADMLVMTGLLGLLAYLALWFCFYREVFRLRSLPPAAIAAMLFWATAFFVEDLFIFNTTITFMTLFSMFAFITFLSMDSHEH